MTGSSAEFSVQINNRLINNTAGNQERAKKNSLIWIFFVFEHFPVEYVTKF